MPTWSYIITMITVIDSRQHLTGLVHTNTPSPLLFTFYIRSTNRQLKLESSWTEEPIYDSHAGIKDLWCKKRTVDHDLYRR